ncbi:MAG: DOMON domain-containing protein [Thermoplasmata archaeon]|nr:DOMON domain-containing protein [Thermoplasmata archaeon]
MILAAFGVEGHAPSDMDVEYDEASGRLNVTITHNVADPGTHFVDRVRVEVDGEEEVDEGYSDQPTSGTFTYLYNVTPQASEQIKVRAECNQGGDIEEEMEFDPWNGNGGNQTSGNASSDLDGAVADGEYDFSFSFGGGELEVHWSIVGSDLHMALVGQTSGWVSIGFDYSLTMADSDMVFGFVDGTGTVFVYDQWSRGSTGPHPPDTAEGGTYDITSFNGSEAGGVTTIEFGRPLDTGDAKDRVIPSSGSMKVIWATGTSDAFDMHTQAGFGTIDFVTGEASEEIKVGLWPYHAALMGAGTAVMLVGIVIGMTQRKKKWW